MVQYPTLALSPLPSPDSSDVEATDFISARRYHDQILSSGLCSLGPCGHSLHYERKLGDGEVSYYLPSRAAGVNDMYVSDSDAFSTRLTISLQVSSPRVQGTRTLWPSLSGASSMGHHAYTTPIVGFQSSHARL